MSTWTKLREVFCPSHVRLGEAAARGNTSKVEEILAEADDPQRVLNKAAAYLLDFSRLIPPQLPELREKWLAGFKLVLDKGADPNTICEFRFKIHTNGGPFVLYEKVPLATFAVWRAGAGYIDALLTHENFNGSYDTVTKVGPVNMGDPYIRAKSKHVSDVALSLLLPGHLARLEGERAVLDKRIGGLRKGAGL